MRGRLLTAAAVVVLAATGSLTACAPGPEAPSETPVAAGEAQEAGVPLAELETAEIELAPGDELRVIVDTPGVSWTAESTDAAVLGIDDPGTGEEARVVTVTALAAGTASLVFTGAGEDRFEVDRALTVSE
ncbi:hypothetical protein [Microbacterium tumbae]